MTLKLRLKYATWHLYVCIGLYNNILMRNVSPVYDVIKQQ